MKKIILKKTTSTIFLAIVLVVGTFAAISPSSFIIKGAHAQSESESYNYGDIYDKNPYNNRYGQDYQSDYKKSDSYGKDTDYDKYKKDSNNSVSVKKLKCNNINVNLNNINATFGSPVESGGADGSTNNGAVAAQGGENLADSGFMNDDNNGNKSFVDKENNFAFVCINNNNNNNNSGGTGNTTDGNGSGAEKLNCEECFNRYLTPQQIDELLPIEGGSRSIPLETIDELCDILFLVNSGAEAANLEALISDRTSATQEQIDALIDCLRDSGVFDPRPPITR